MITGYYIRLLLLICTAGLFLSCNRDQNKEQDVDGWSITGNNEAAYEIGKNEALYNSKPVYYIRSVKNVDSGFGAIVKNFPPGSYIGKRIRLTGYIKGDNIYGRAGMWMRVDGSTGDKPFGKTLSFDNIKKRPILGSTGWTKYDIVLDVLKDSRMIYYGVLLSGIGERCSFPILYWKRLEMTFP